MKPERIVVEAWSPDYGPAHDPDDDIGAADVDVAVEVPAGRWAPVPVPPGDAAADVVFIDGVQRVDARITLVDGDRAVAAIAGSFAAGSCHHRGGQALLGSVEVRRGLFSRASDVALDCGGGVSYAPYAATATDAGTLSRAMTEQMRTLEKAIADRSTAELVVIDGPLSGGRHVAGAVGFVKTHRRSYLDGHHEQVVARLAAAERTPLFLTVTNFSRWSWYLRLPGPVRHPWAGVVRCEASGDLSPSAARQLAARTQTTLPRFASSPHRDPRAPQNLTPVGAVEQTLRHRLGDPALLNRLLRRTCARWQP